MGEQGVGLHLPFEQALLGVDIALDELLAQGLQDHVPPGRMHEPQDLRRLDDSQQIAEFVVQVPGQPVDVLPPPVIVEDVQEPQDPRHPHFRYRCDLHSPLPFLPVMAGGSSDQ